jgi:NCS2 family nucleobase:cation symporter-2
MASRVGAYLVAQVGSYLGRSSDRQIIRPTGLAYWLDDRPSVPASLGLALQHLAIQAIYVVFPVTVAAAVTQDPAEVTRFLCLSILTSAFLQAVQLLTRGPIGAGYPIPATQSTACLGAYVLTAQAGGDFHAITAMVCLTGLSAIVLTFAMHRLRVLLPNEVAGVVVILIGVSLIGVAAGQLGLQPGETPSDEASVGIVLATIVAIMVVSLSKSRAVPFAVLIGALFGTVLSFLLGEALPNAAAIIAERPWIALPQPFLPDFGQVSSGPMLAYLLALVAIQATAAGSLVAMQRACDAGWTRPDPVPLRRGLLANGIAFVFAGLIGGTAPGSGSAAVALSIASGVLARRVVWVGVGLLVVVALCPKILALAVLTPTPVKAAMLLYVAGFLMGQGCQLIAARLLDTRRMMIVATGLSAGVLVAIAPLPFLAHVPALASPPSFGALVAFLVNLVTLPLVPKRAQLTLPLDMMAGRVAHEWIAERAAEWGLKPATAQAGERALVELTELLVGRGAPVLDLRSWHFEDRVALEMTWDGAPLPEPTTNPSPEDLLGTVEEQERFIVWLATRGAMRFTQRMTERGCEARVLFED